MISPTLHDQIYTRKSRVRPLKQGEHRHRPHLRFAPTLYLLLSDDLPDVWMSSPFEGFLTAIAIGPVMVTPEQWLPRVFGGDREGPLPELPVIKFFKRVVNLIS